jgi:hypothetical protein
MTKGLTELEYVRIHVSKRFAAKWSVNGMRIGERKSDWMMHVPIIQQWMNSN